MQTTSHRRPYVGEGADGARRSAIIDRNEADTLPFGEQRDAALASAERWDQQAADLAALAAAQVTEDDMAENHSQFEAHNKAYATAIANLTASALYGLAVEVTIACRQQGKPIPVTLVLDQSDQGDELVFHTALDATGTALLDCGEDYEDPNCYAGNIASDHATHLWRTFAEVDADGWRYHLSIPAILAARGRYDHHNAAARH